MKKLNLILVILSSFFFSCGRDAELISAPKAFNEQVIGLQAFNVQAGKMETTVRAFTLLFYPRTEHIQDFSYEVTDLSRPSWETILNTLPYRERVVTDYPVDMKPFLKVQKMVAAIQSVGRARDNAWRVMDPLDRRMEEINGEKAKINERIEEIEPKIDFGEFTCFYAKRPRGGKKYECKTKKEGEFKKRKKARGCDDLLEFSFTYDNEEEEKIYEEAIGKCAAVADELTALEEKIQLLDSEFDELFTKFEPLDHIRKSGEGVVLDLLQAAERYTKEINQPQVYVATGSSKEKPNVQDVLSEVRIDWQKIFSMQKKKADLEAEMADTRVNSYQFDQLRAEHTAVVKYLANPMEKFSLWIEFGLNYSGGTRSQEYSIQNGGIKDFQLVWNGPNPALNFKIVNDDFWIECALDVTNDDPAMGYRAVGEVFAHYPDGSITRGGMKLEFNMR